MEVRHCEERGGAALLFTRTKQMLGRVTGSQIASASFASFLSRLRQALTPLGGTSRTWWPSAINWRASILIGQGARRAKHASRSICCAERLMSPRRPQSPTNTRSWSEIQRRDRGRSTHTRHLLTGQPVTRIPRWLAITLKPAEPGVRGPIIAVNASSRSSQSW